MIVFSKSQTLIHKLHFHYKSQSIITTNISGYMVAIGWSGINTVIIFISCNLASECHHCKKSLFNEDIGFKNSNK